MEEGKFRLYELRGDKMPAAIHVKMDPFQKTSVKIKPDDKFYIFSDGYQDQFGGPHKSKIHEEKNLKKLFLQIHQLPMDKQKLFLENTINDWKGHSSR